MTKVTTTPASRNARACEACRISKSRCVYSQENDTCRKCYQAGFKCIVRSKARPKRIKASDQVNGPETTSPTSQNIVLELPALPLQVYNDNVNELEDHHEAAFNERERPRCPRDPSSSTSSSLLQPHRLTLYEAQALLDEFQKLSPWFPFVEICPDDTVYTLSWKSPFLLLAVFTVAGRSRTSIYHQLDHEFRRILSQKLVVEGQKNLDLLQGLLVYLAWTPMITGLKRNHTLTYLNMASGLASDLGFDDDSLSHYQPVAIDDGRLKIDGVFTQSAKDAYLGLQYLTTTVAVMFPKFRSMQNPTPHDFAFIGTETVDHVKELQHIVRLHVFCKIIVAASTTDVARNHDRATTSTSDLQLQISLIQLQEIIRTTPKNLKNTGAIALQERYARIIIYAYHLDLGLKRTSPHKYQQPQPRPGNITHDFDCLEACKSFFECMLSIPSEDYVAFTIVQWSMMAVSFVILSRLTFHMAADLNWSAENARQNVPMTIYIESLCWRFQKLTKSGNLEGKPPTIPDWLYVMQRILETLSKTYSKGVTDIKQQIPSGQDDSLSSDVGGMCPLKDADLTAFLDTSFLQASDQARSQNAFDGESSKSSSSMPVYFDIWSTMTGSWAKVAQ